MLSKRLLYVLFLSDAYNGMPSYVRPVRPVRPQPRANLPPNGFLVGCDGRVHAWVGELEGAEFAVMRLDGLRLRARSSELRLRMDRKDQRHSMAKTKIQKEQRSIEPPDVGVSWIAQRCTRPKFSWKRVAVSRVVRHLHASLTQIPPHSHAVSPQMIISSAG